MLQQVNALKHVYLPLASEVCGKVMFLLLSVYPSTASFPQCIATLPTVPWAGYSSSGQDPGEYAPKGCAVRAVRERLVFVTQNSLKMLCSVKVVQTYQHLANQSAKMFVMHKYVSEN